MDDPLIDLATVPPVPLPPAAQAARGPLAGVVADLLAIPDRALDRPWRWLPSDIDESVDVRYGLYRIHERMEAANAAITAGHVPEGTSVSIGATETMGPAIPALRAMDVARWELHGVLTALTAADWDADPGGGEWTIRQTLGHIIGSQRAYGWYNAWFLTRREALGLAVRPPESVFPPEPSEEDEAAGSPTEVMGRLDEVVDANIAASGVLDSAAMGVGARWMGMAVPIEFRLGRYGSHIREHTVQVDKTLAMIGRRPTEVERVVRLILGSYGRLESLFVGRSADALAQPLGDGSTPVAIL
ncbi:MAG: DinB family protein, partial [Chloroflexota bacterium]